MTNFYLHVVPGDHSSILTSGKLPDLAPVTLKRPTLQPPRSSKGRYTESELSTAAAMLAKLRLRHDVVDHLRGNPEPVVYDSDTTVDAVVDRLLNRL